MPDPRPPDPRLGLVHGVPETALGAELLDRLPSHAPRAPWDVRCEAVVWAHPAPRAARSALPPALREQRPLLVVGAVLRYATTPVGGYDEVLGAVLGRTGLRPWASVGLMAVDSEASVVGGRVDWALPKTLATFAGRPLSSVIATGAAAGWRVSVETDAWGPRVPAGARFRVRQELPGGRLGEARLSGSGRARAALVTVAVESEGPLPTWLRPGRHPGVVVTAARFRLPPLQLLP